MLYLPVPLSSPVFSPRASSTKAVALLRAPQAARRGRKTRRWLVQPLVAHAHRASASASWPFSVSTSAFSVTTCPSGARTRAASSVRDGHADLIACKANRIAGLELGSILFDIHAPKRDPSSNRAQSIEIAHKDASLVGSRSAPIGTLPSLAFSLLHQSARRDFVGGPARVLKHTRKHVGGGAGLLVATPNRPRFDLIRWLSGQCRFHVNQRFAADLMDCY